MLNKERQRCTAISVREQRSKGQKRKKVRQFTFYRASSIVKCSARFNAVQDPIQLTAKLSAVNGFTL